jgi:hypothetical protein
MSTRVDGAEPPLFLITAEATLAASEIYLLPERDMTNDH